MTDTTEIPEPGPARDQLVAEVVGWVEVPDGMGGTLWVNAADKPTGYYTPNSMGRAGNPFRPFEVSADALAALEAWRVGKAGRYYLIESPDWPESRGVDAECFAAVLGEGGSCVARHYAPTLRAAATAALIATRRDT